MATVMARTDRLALRLAIAAPGQVETPVEVDAPADTTLGAVAEALAHALGVEAEELVLERTGRPLPRDAELGTVGLRHGDRLLLTGEHDGARTRRVGRSPAQLALAVTGGPAAGRTFPLTPGDHIVGRDDGCAVRVDDPALSGRHVRLRVNPGETVEATDLGSRNGTRVEGAALAPDEPVPLAPGAALAAGRSQFTIEPPPAEGHPPPVAGDGTIRFNRPPRVRRLPEQVVRPFPPPPEAAQRARLPLGASLIPLALGLGLYLATRIPTMLFFAALSPLMAVSTFVEDRRSGRKGFEQRRREYRQKLAALHDELDHERTRELAARRIANPDAAQILRRAAHLEPTLWERRAGDDDFLTLRLGAADRPSLFTVRIDQGGDAELRRETEEVAEWFAVAPGVPVELPLGELGAAGICGPDERVGALVRSLVAQAAVLHSPRELVIAAALPEERASEWNWLVWLPHTADASAPLGRGLVSGPLAARGLVEELVRLIDERRETAQAGFGARRQAGWTSVLLVLDEAVAPERALVADLLGNAAEAGVAVLWLGRERRDLPGECTGIVEVDSNSARLSYTDARSGETSEDVSADGLALELAEKLSRSLAPVRDTSARAGGGVPDRVTLLELLGVEDVDSDWIASRWNERGELAAVLGANLQGPFSVNLRADGPHALVAGMTGAGKSELLQSFIASLASAHPPTRLSFLLIDYKGGAAFKDCTALPHTVGLVTDLDAHLTQRALVSLNAELQRRERLLRDAGAKDLADMERRDADTVPPSLVIVIDEFATLAKEVPDFIEGVVDVAQRGRSLGVHLLLATQRPGGVVSENIRANTNLRIALRVNEPAESTDVIGVAEAARIPRDRPGRAYARTGHGELTEFQAAYVGGVSARRSDDRSIRVRTLGFDGTKAERAAASEETETDLRRLVTATARAAEELQLERPRSPWLEPLAPVVPLESLPASKEPGRHAVLGVVDDPGRQLQEPFVVDLDVEGSVLVFGASGSGKTTLLRTIALSLAQSASPDELQLYGLDFATRGLKVLEALPHCGSVITDDDEERTARLFAVLRATLERRKVLFAESGVFNLADYTRTASGRSAPPRIVVMLDGYAGFAAAFERVNLGELIEALPRLVGEGRPLGVHFAITADRRGAVPNALAGIIPTKIVLRMADEDEFSSLGVPLRSVRGAKLPPGRGFLAGGLELQTALVGADGSGEGQAGAIADLSSALRERHGDRRAPAIEPLPSRVDRDSLPAPSASLHAVLGIADAELSPAEVDLSERHFLVLGPYRSGRSTSVATIVESMRRGPRSLHLHLLAPRRSPLAELEGWDTVAEGAQACEDAASRLAAELEPGPTDRATVIVVDDGEELAESPAGPDLETIVRKGRDLDVRVVCACERQAAQRAFGGWLRELRKEEHGLLLAPDPDVDGDLLAVRLPRRTNPVFPPGRGYLVKRGEIELIQVAGN
jgi:S-DNA-T family DNA segregation ATPase FtsK/SpoIIIE